MIEFIYSPLFVVTKNKKNISKETHLLSIKEELKNCRTFFDEANDPIIVLDRIGKFLAVNRKFVRISRYSRKDLVGKNVFLTPLLTKKSLKEVLKIQRRLLRGEKVAAFEVDGVRKDGVIIPFEANITVIKHRGKLNATLIILRDLSERKKSENELALYKRGFDTSPNSMIVVSYDNGNPCVVQANRGFSRMYGYKSGDIMGKSPKMLSSGLQDKSFYKQMWSDLLNPKKGYWSGEITNKKKNGKLIDVILTISTIFDEKGDASYFAAHHVDITKVKEAEKKLQKMNLELEEKVATRTQELTEREKQFRTIVEDVPSVIYRCKNTRNWPMIFISDAIHDLSGYRASEFLSDKPRIYGKLIHPDDRDQVWRNIQVALKKKKTYLLYYRLVDKDGFIRWVHEKGKGVFNEKSKLEYLDGVITDITSEREIETAKHEFLSLASHQLRTPLTAINWLSQAILSKGNLDSFQEEFLNDILKSNARMVRLVDDLLNVSRLEAGAIAINPQRTTIAKFVSDVINEVRVDAKQAIVFKNKIGQLRIPIDRSIVHQSIVNLFSNAAKYSPDRSTITISIEQRKDNIAISIKDEGIGISKQDMRHLFERFFRTTGAQHMDTKGSGLGLHIVKKMLESCNGTVELKSKPKKGSKFTILLPITGPKKKGRPLKGRVS